MDDLSALVSSRICHDMLNPLGAIGNGVELLAMTGPAGAADGPELALVAESVARATARLKLFRLAFGNAPPGQTMGGAALEAILAENFTGPRLTMTADLPAELPRSAARLALLAALCAEAALPRGGTLTLRLGATDGELVAEADRIELDPALWAHVTGPAPTDVPGPAEVQFALLPGAAAAAGRSLALTQGATRLALRF